MAALAAPLALPFGGAEGSLVMFFGYEQRAFAPGENFNFTIHVFYNGAAVSPPDPPTVTVIGSNGLALYAVPVFESGRGRYAGRYTVLAADIGDSGGIRLMAEAVYSGDFGQGPETARTWMDILVQSVAAMEDSPRVVARLVESSERPVVPGTRLAFECCVTAGGMPADPDGLAFRMRHSVAWPGDTDKIMPQRTGPGSYIVRYDVPRQNRSDRFFLDATWANATADIFTGAQVGLDLFSVVYHELGRTGTRVDYELLVFDRKGAPVNGSSVLIEITAGVSGSGTGPAAGKTVQMDLGRTDPKGRVRSLMDLGGSADMAFIDGWANTSRFSQRFFGSVALFGGRDGQSAAPAGIFRVVRSGIEGQPGPGATVRLTYRAYSDGRPLRDVPVDCYLEMSRVGPEGNDSISVSGQRVISDDEGRLHLNISFPAGYSSQAKTIFVGPEGVTGQRAQTSDVLVAEGAASSTGPGWVNASFSRAEPGNPLKVSVRGLGLAAASAGWQIDHGPLGSEQRQWSAWTTMEWPLLPPAGGERMLRGSIALPAGLRTGLNITVLLQVANSSGERSDADFTLRLKAPAEPAAGNDLCCLAGAAVVNIALFAFVFVQYRNAKKAPPPTQFGDRQVDARIGDILNPPGGPPARPPALPFKAELVQSVDCAACGRRIARGNMAWGCACGKKFHEHCLGKEEKCAHCGREWSRR